MPLPAGAVIAGYRVVRLLGEGGMGAVYLVQHPDLPRQDVLKVMHGGMAHQAGLRARFEHEARLAAALNHPNIVQVFDRGVTDDGQLWIRMQYVEGTDAAQALAAGPMQPRRVLHIVRSIGSALDYAHRAGLLHRDIKPANILLTPGGHADDPEHVMLTDFGIAKAMDTDVRLTGTGQAFLTPAYSAPERFGTAPIDSRIDVYALGCVAFELLTGQLPYPHQDFLVLMAAHDRQPVPDVRELRPELPAGVTEVLRTAMAKDREQRYPTCRAFAEDLAAALQQTDTRPVPPPPPSAPPTIQRNGPRSNDPRSNGPGSDPRNPTPVGGWTAGPRGPVQPGTVAAGRAGRRRTVALAVGATLLVAGGVTAAVLWPDGGPEATDSAGAPVPGPTTVYGTEYNVADYLSESFSEPGDLDGVTGIHPGAELSDEFEQRVLGVAPDLQYLDYSAESYDATVLVALAASMSGTTNAQDFKDVIDGLTYGGAQCPDYASCLAVIEDGDNPNFDGVSGPLDFTDAGEPARATYAVVQIGADNRIATAETEFVTAGEPGRVGGFDGPPRGGGSEAQEPLVIGTLLPLSGDLQYFGPSAEAGVRLAVQEINAAGGVLGRPVELVTGDSGDLSTDTAARTVDRLLAAGVDAIVGAGASSVTLEVLDRVTSAGVLMISPANTSNELTTAPDDDLYFRVSPPERLQARAIADRIIEDGHDSVGMLAIQSTYGSDMAGDLTAHLRAAGIDADDITTVAYAEGTADFGPQVGRLVDAAPEAVVVFGYAETADIIAELNGQGIGPAR